MRWDKTQYRSALEGDSMDMAHPVIQLIDYDADGTLGIEVIATGAGSVGAGPPRAISRVWEYKANARAWIIDREIALPSEYRIHAIHDADDTAFRGDLDVALLLYQQAIENPDLLDWKLAATEQLYLGAYVRYKMIAIHTIRGDEDAATTLLSDMSLLYFPNSDQWEFVEMAVGFRNAYLAGGVEAACDFVVSYAEARSDQILAPLGSQVLLR
jgi:hypothetical protein